MGQTLQESRLRLMLHWTGDRVIRAKMIRIAPLALALWFGSVSAQMPAFDATLEASLESARAAFDSLESLAAACVAEPGSQDGPATGPSPCQQFRNAINGATLATYLESCAPLTEWRDQFITQRMENGNSAATETSDRFLELLVNIEYFCGDDALIRDNSVIVAAYRQSATGSGLGNAVGDALQYQLDSSRQRGLIDQERSRLSQSAAGQQQRAEQRTRRQLEQLELELLRQQNRPQFPR